MRSGSSFEDGLKGMRWLGGFSKYGDVGEDGTAGGETEFEQWKASTGTDIGLHLEERVCGGFSPVQYIVYNFMKKQHERNRLRNT